MLFWLAAVHVYVPVSCDARLATVYVDSVLPRATPLRLHWNVIPVLAGVVTHARVTLWPLSLVGLLLSAIATVTAVIAERKENYFFTSLMLSTGIYRFRAQIIARYSYLTHV